MPEIVLARQPVPHIPEADREAARRAVFGVVDGLGELEKKKWRRFWNWLFRLEPGEIAHISTRMERSGPYHRRHFAMEQALFGVQDRFRHFEQFLYWIKIGAGWVQWAAGPDGGIVPIPRSISYRKADQAEFEQFHSQVLDFLLGEHASRYLWPHLDDAQAHDMMLSVIGEFL